MAYLTQREMQWAANQFGTGVRTTEDVEKQYQRIYRERTFYVCWNCGKDARRDTPHACDTEAR